MALRDESIVLILIVLENCNWQNGYVGRDDNKVFPISPDTNDVEPITKWIDKEEVWKKVRDGVQVTVSEIQFQNDLPSERERRKRLAEMEFSKGNFLLTIQQISQAIKAYSRAIDLNPYKVSAYNNRGNVYKEKGEVENAIQDYDRAIELNPGHVKA